MTSGALDFSRVDTSDVALIFEGGGMRASYSAGAVVELIRNRIDFPVVYGISAGTSHSVNYLSRDAVRAKQSFVDLVDIDNFGGWKTFLQGKGYFNASFLYEGLVAELDGTDHPLSFDWDAFVANPGDVHIEAFDVNTGETVAWMKHDMPTVRDMMLRVRASSSMPVFMPHTIIDGRELADGGLGCSWGIPLEAAKRDGFERFFIVRTRPRDYRKKTMDAKAQALLRAGLATSPRVADRIIQRPPHYNALCDEIERLEQAGKAYVFYANDVAVSSRETDRAALEASFSAGHDQALSELAAWHAFLAGA